MRDTINKLWIQTSIETSFQCNIFCTYTYTLTTRKLQVTYCHSTYQMTVLLSEMSIFCVLAKFEIQLASYAPKQASQCLSSKPFVRT